jgi:hypothetical protein
LYTVKEKGGKPDRNHTPFQEIHTETSRMRTLMIMTRNPKELDVNEFDFWEAFNVL